jgi:hypothetical protein
MPRPKRVSAAEPEPVTGRDSPRRDESLEITTGGINSGALVVVVNSGTVVVVSGTVVDFEPGTVFVFVCAVVLVV